MYKRKCPFLHPVIPKHKIHQRLVHSHIDVSKIVLSVTLNSAVIKLI